MGSVRTTGVFGVYANAEFAATALDDLLGSGFTCSDISVLLPDNRSTRAFILEKCAKASETATSVTSAGRKPGSEWLSSLCEFSIPGVGPMIAGGPILSSVAGVTVGGTLGGLVGSLIEMGIPEYEAKLYEAGVKDGSILLSINCVASEQIGNAKISLARTGARDVASTSEAISVEIEGDDSDGGNVFDGDDLFEGGSLAESPG